jgi:hypothetical protein
MKKSSHLFMPNNNLKEAILEIQIPCSAHTLHRALILRIAPFSILTPNTKQLRIIHTLPNQGCGPLFFQLLSFQWALSFASVAYHIEIKLRHNYHCDM